MPRDGPVPVRRLDRLADRAGRGRPRRALRLGRRLGRDGRVRRVVGPRRRRAVHAGHRRPRSTRGGWRGLARTSTSATSGRCRSTSGRTAASASSTCRTGPVCCWSRPGSSTCTSRTSPTGTRTSTYAGTARRSCCTTRTALIVLEEEDVSAALRGRGRPGAAAPGDGRVAGQPGDRPGHVAEAVDFYLRFALAAWSGWSGSSTARGATTSGCATCARTCHPRSPTRSRSWCPGATTATLEELSLRCFAWLDELPGSLTPRGQRQRGWRP